MTSLNPRADIYDPKTLAAMDQAFAAVWLMLRADDRIRNIDVLRDKYKRPVPAADLLMADPYKELMPLVEEAKDLGSGVIRGVECDHLAFRTEEVDWQIWIAQGDRPYPCRYVITSTKVKGSPQYTVEVRDWKTGDEVASDSFSLDVPQGAKELKPGDVPDFDELPGIFTKKGAQ